MLFNEIYERLCEIETISNKIEFIDNEVIIIQFNEYLKITASDYFIELNDGLTHWHPSYEKIFIEIIDIALGNIIFIEFRSWYNKIIPNIKILKRDKFENKKHKYMNKKKVRIYTGVKILQYAQ